MQITTFQANADRSIMNATPVNLQASKMLWKSPWWAKAPPDVKEKVTKAAEVVTWEAFIDYFKAPPEKSGTGNPAEDRRVSMIRRIDGTVEIIVGFAYRNARFRKRARADGTTKIEPFYDYIWWAIRPDGSFAMVNPRRMNAEILKPNQAL